MSIQPGQLEGKACVIFNPAAGKNRAGRRIEALRQNWGGRVTLMPTERPGHASELAHQAALDGFTLVVAAGGDGTVHEVANGLLDANRTDVCFGVLPIGSANDYAHSLMHDPDATSGERHVDVGIVRSRGKERYFVCCLGLGFNGAVTLESRKIRRLQGVALYGLATIQALRRHYRCPTMSLALDDAPPRPLPTLMFSLLLGRREGGFVLAPHARLDDGLFDFVHTGALSRLEVICLLPRLALFGPPTAHAKLLQGRCHKVHLTSPDPLIIHTDGEFFARPEDEVREVEIEVLPGRMKVRTLLV